jgi:hypothetical protein
MTAELSNSNLEMELEQVRFLEFALPDEVYYSIYGSEIVQEYHTLLNRVGCREEEYGKAERLYRTLLTSILSDKKFWSAYIN